MDNFKIGDCVSVKDDFIEGEIVNIKEDVAYVEFRTAGGGGCLPFDLSELEHKESEINRNEDFIQNYVIFDKKTYVWQMVYCNSHRPDGEELEDIAKAMISYQYCGKFSSGGTACMNGGGIKNDTEIFIMNENGVQYLWQLGSKVSDMEGFIVPHLYHVRKVGMLV